MLTSYISVAKQTNMGKYKDLTGSTHGEWTVISHHSNENGRHKWNVRCSCGVESVMTSAVLSYSATSCIECARKKIIRNPYMGTKEHRSWSAMKKRCYEKSHENYKYYGGKGVIVAAIWKSDFKRFLKDVGYAPSEEHTIDRIDPRGNYEPGNVRWLTNMEQQSNRTNNKRLTFNGETLTHAQWARKLGVSKELIGDRFRAGWDTEAILTKPNNKGVTKDEYFNR